jgi:putative PIN family toxin of toxin-antitoxin system
MPTIPNRVVIDTNALVSALSSKSIFHWLINLIFDGSVVAFVTDEILLEYEEVLHAKYSKTVAANFIIALKESTNVCFVQIYYRWNVLRDEDDNKFVDCYVAANADFLITNDSDFNILKNITFPRVNTITIEEYRQEHFA